MKDPYCAVYTVGFKHIHLTKWCQVVVEVADEDLICESGALLLLYANHAFISLNAETCDYEHLHLHLPLFLSKPCGVGLD